MPLTNGGPHRRVSSPRGGGSTLTTVAPMSPSIMVQNGPDRIRERSRTKISSSGVTEWNYNQIPNPKSQIPRRKSQDANPKRKSQAQIKRSVRPLGIWGLDPGIWGLKWLRSAPHDAQTSQ